MSEQTQKIQFEFLLKMITMSNETKTQFLPMEEIKDIFKDVRDFKNKDSAEYELYKKLQIALVTNMTIAHLLNWS